MFALKQNRLNYLKVARAPFALPFYFAFLCFKIFEISAGLWSYLFAVLTVSFFVWPTDPVCFYIFGCSLPCENQLIFSPCPWFCALAFFLATFFVFFKQGASFCGHLLPLWPNRFIAVNPPAIAASQSESCCSSARVPHPFFCFLVGQRVNYVITRRMLLFSDLLKFFFYF